MGHPVDQDSNEDRTNSSTPNRTNASTPSHLMHEREAKENVYYKPVKKIPPKKKRLVVRKPKAKVDKLNYIDYIDDKKFGLKEDRPKASGAYDLRSYTMGREKRKPTSTDVANVVH